MEPFEKSTIRVPSATQGWNLSIRKYLPNAEQFQRPVPVIVMAQPIIPKEPYAQAFAERGYACLLFDFRRWGDSDGTPKNKMDIENALEDYRTVVTFAKEQAEFDSHRIIPWGAGESGGYVIQLAGEDWNPKLKAAMTQCPWTGYTPLLPRFTFGTFRGFCISAWDSMKQRFGFGPIYVPIAGPPGSEAMIRSRRLTKESKYYGIKVPASTILEIKRYKPYKLASNIKCPILIVQPMKDHFCLPKGAVEVDNDSPWVILDKIPHAGHIDVYPDQKDFRASLRAQLDFLKTYVPL
ncbi:alpha/beta-hydrolase [Pluteus cervinus]|uniref:Alpha/beta-hydrolase n=1 Tax=Pluteus cervinus TaxID=181527 RepID=A0ACD3B5R3_9AGAR|nr:alpha/beta-hydrolase [Pluteus cervinus]